jgi:hypothetical protein
MYMPTYIHLLTHSVGLGTQTVKRNSSPAQYDLPLLVVSYKDLYGWSMDDIVRAVGTKNNCTRVRAPRMIDR